MLTLYNYRFAVNMGCGRDTWALYGEVYGREGFQNGSFIFVSTPVKFDRETERVETFSGSVYQLMNPADDKEKIFREIEKVIELGGYESW